MGSGGQLKADIYRSNLCLKYSLAEEQNKSFSVFRCHNLEEHRTPFADIAPALERYFAFLLYVATAVNIMTVKFAMTLSLD